jgi:anti-sigma regulatory factor (Ser/Thr protein kinase)
VDPMAFLGEEARRNIQSGRCSAWTLPPDETCARTARVIITAALTALDLPGHTIDDAATMASELATNGLLHGLRASAAPAEGPLELWLYHRTEPVAELVCKLFDPRRDGFPPPSVRVGGVAPPDPYAERGRGLAVVRALASRCGVHLTRSRLRPWALSGKAAWFSVTVPDMPARPLPSTGEAATCLHRLLAERGISGIRRGDVPGVSVVSVRCGLTVWVRDGFTWRDQYDACVRYPLADLVEAVEAVVRRHEELLGQPPGRGPEGGGPESGPPSGPVGGRPAGL